jgi:diguanylate cyclase (GGDEF)-like protein
MNDIESLLKLVEENEVIARKFHEIETRVLSILNFADLFEVLLTEIREKFQIPYVWLALIENSEVPELIHALGDSDLLKSSVRIVNKKTFHSLVPTDCVPLLINSDLMRFASLFPESRNFLVGSMAIAPITLDGVIIGSLNQADFSVTRYAPGIDTSLLERLALKVSLCLANVTAHEKLVYLAFHDPLTGLLNRRVMESILKREFFRAKRYHASLSIVFLDLNDFKRVNDNLGHQVGDLLLQHFANCLTQLFRNSDVVARFAGDEFVLILPETTAEKAESLMLRIESFLAESPLEVNGKSVPVSISFGIASSEEPNIKDADSLLRAADKRLYDMKGQKAPAVSLERSQGL